MYLFYNQKKILIIFILSTVLFSNTYIIKDEDGLPISNAQIYNSNYNFGIISDSEGLFNIYQKDCFDVEIQHIGYQKKVVHLCDIENEITLIKSPIATQEIKVIGDIGKTKLKNMVSDVSIISKTNIKNSNKFGLEDILKSTSNVNYCPLTSRPRYFQIRGIGEEEQFVGQGGPNYYVGIMLDDINLSGIGMPLFMYDVEQVEVFKGAQSFIIGQNAMAGLIRINTVKPKTFKETRFSLNIGNFNKKNLTLIHNQPINQNIALRWALAKNDEEGFIYNDFLNKYTNNRDELISNLKLSYNKISESGDLLNLLLTNQYSNMNNGNDKWSHNSFNDLSNFITYSDYIGSDSYAGNSNTINATYQKKESYSINAIIASSENELDYNYDGDWSNPDHWFALYNDPNSSEYNQENVDAGGYYPFPIEENRKRTDSSFELKFENTYGKSDLIFGFFNKNLTEDDTANGFIFDLGNLGFVNQFQSSYEITFNSFYYQHQYNLNPKSLLILNIRNDAYKNKFHYTQITDDYNYEPDDVDLPVSSEPYHYSNSISSYRIGVKYDNFYTSVSKGHKAGGFNQTPTEYIDETNRTYAPETNTNLDLGFSNRVGDFYFDINFFYMDRQDVHATVQDQIGDCPTCYVYFTKNVAEGHNLGFDLETTYNIDSETLLFLSLGLLKTERGAYSYESSGGTQFVEKGELANAPGWTISTGLEINITKNLFLRYDIIAKDSFLWHDDEDELAPSLTLHNANMRYKLNEKTYLTFWGKNLTNEMIASHEYHFSLGAGLPEGEYESPIEPMTYGIKLDYKF